MQFMVTSFDPSRAVEIYRRFQEQGRGIPDVLSYVDSWVDAGLGRVWQIMETDDVALLQEWIAFWAPLVDDFEVVLGGLARMLDPFADRVQVVDLRQATDDEDIAGGVDIALYDTFAQSQGEHADFAQIRAASRAHQVVVYSWNADPVVVRASLDRGAAGYVAKRTTAEELVRALERVHAGERVVVGEDAVASPDPGDWPGRGEGLSPRESEILVYITQGLSNEEIATLAYLSPNTIKSLIRSTYRKIGASSRSQAVLWGVDHGFRPPPGLS